KTCHAALDIHEFFSSQVRAEARLCDRDIAQLQGHPCSPHAVASVGNVGEGAAVHQSRCVLQRLDEVGLDSVLQEGCHGPRGVKVICGHRLTLEIVGHDDPAQSLLQVSDIVRQTEDRHDLGGNSDDKV